MDTYPPPFIPVLPRALVMLSALIASSHFSVETEKCEDAIKAGSFILL